MTGVIGYRFDLLDRSLNLIGELHPSKAVAARVENNINNTIKRTLSSLRLDPSEANAINPLTDRLRPMMVTADGSFPLGVFVWSDAPRERWTYGRPMVGSLVDQAINLDQDTDMPWSFRAGTSIETALRYLLASAEVPAVAIDDSDATVGTKSIAWDVGTKLLQIINEVCALGSYYSLYFDNAGVATVKEATPLEAGDIRTLQQVLDAQGLPGTSRVTLRYGIPEGPLSFVQGIVQGSIGESDDLLDAPNRYLVIDNGVTESPIYGHWDVPDSAPHSFKNRGVRIVRRVDMQGVGDRRKAGLIARLRGMADRSTFQWATFAADPNPLHDTFDVVEYFGERWHEQSWTLELTATGSHTHEIRRVWGEELE